MPGAPILSSLRCSSATRRQIPLDLGADDAGAAAIGELLQRLAQQLARGEMKRPAVFEILVAENPPDAGGPRQRPEGRGSATTVRLGEPVISSSPMPPPRVNDANTRAPAESSVVVATPILWPLFSAARKAGTVRVLARE